METFPKKRGRPRKVPAPSAQTEALFSATPAEVRDLLGFEVPSDRTRANRFYAEKAREVVRELSKDVRIPHDPAGAARLRAGMDWIAQRSIVLAELGRMMQDNPTEEEGARFQAAVTYVADKRPGITAKDAAAYVRRVRLRGESKRIERVRELHHEVNRLVTAYRRRYPEGDWREVLEALDHSAAQIRKKLR